MSLLAKTPIMYIQKIKVSVKLFINKFLFWTRIVLWVIALLLGTFVSGMWFQGELSNDPITYQNDIQVIQSPKVPTAASSTNEVKAYVSYKLQRLGLTEKETLRLMVVIPCESNYRIDAKNINKDGTKDNSLFQVNSSHTSNAKRMGIDIHTVDGNIAYAAYLYKRNGLGDWYSSKSCWSKSL